MPQSSLILIQLMLSVDTIFLVGGNVIYIEILICIFINITANAKYERKPLKAMLYYNDTLTNGNFCISIVILQLLMLKIRSSGTNNWRESFRSNGKTSWKTDIFLQAASEYS